jgi:hypothetical protein
VPDDGVPVDRHQREMGEEPHVLVQRLGQPDLDRFGAVGSGERRPMDGQDGVAVGGLGAAQVHRASLP